MKRQSKAEEALAREIRHLDQKIAAEGKRIDEGLATMKALTNVRSQLQTSLDLSIERRKAASERTSK